MPPMDNSSKIRATSRRPSEFVHRRQPRDTTLTDTTQTIKAVRTKVPQNALVPQHPFAHNSTKTQKHKNTTVERRHTTHIQEGPHCGTELDVSQLGTR
jgi:hypothetical protein